MVASHSMPAVQLGSWLCSCYLSSLPLFHFSPPCAPCCCTRQLLQCWSVLGCPLTALLITFPFRANPVLADLSNSSPTVGPLKMGPVGFPKTSITNYQSTLHNIPNQQRSQVQLLILWLLNSGSCTWVIPNSQVHMSVMLLILTAGN